MSENDPIKDEVLVEARDDLVEMFDGEYPIEIEGLRNSFGDQVIHEDLSLKVKRGEILGVVGGSGSGKSVLMRSIIGLQIPDAGKIEVFGHDTIGALPDEQSGVRSRWGVLFQGGALFSTLTVAENIEVPLKQFYPELDPELLFLDEPTAGLDPIGAAAFDDLTRELQETLGLTVFLITHDLDTLYAICDRVAVIADKKVIAVGTIPELLETDHPWIQEYFNGPRGRGRHASSSRRTARTDTCSRCPPAGPRERPCSARFRASARAKARERTA